jgi:hypothetical protein
MYTYAETARILNALRHARGVTAAATIKPP